MMDLCRKLINEIASFRLELTPVQQPFRPEWHIQDGRQLLSKNVPFWSVPPHIFETNGWNTITFGSQHFREKGLLLPEPALKFCITCGYL